jgi:hypothetical protein
MAAPDDPEAELTRMVRDGVHPTDAAERTELAARKLLGQVPLGVDARHQGVRKALAGGSALLLFLREVFFGGILFLFGAALLLIAIFDGFTWELFGWGAGCALVGAWLLRGAARAWRALRAVSRA